MVSFVQYGGISFESGPFIIKKALLIEIIRLFYGLSIQKGFDKKR
ncbi:hypothetical protein ABFV83_16765 [Lacrimispora sp. BS-2]|uniref:Uncharacterized protein n=1 Tax=Lacrimispora sp. BS-2 TaxID=3151850 RepID=A0AAU7PMI4_9FIRM